MALLLGVPAVADALENLIYTCVAANGVDQRRIEVVYEGKEPLPCRTEYTKWDERETIARALESPGHCQRTAEAVMRNLVKVGFDCGPASAADVEINTATTDPKIADPKIADPKIADPKIDSDSGATSDTRAAAPLAVRPPTQVRPALAVGQPPSDYQTIVAERIAAHTAAVAAAEAAKATVAPPAAECECEPAPAAEAIAPRCERAEEGAAAVDGVASKATAGPSPRVLNYLAALRTAAAAGRSWARTEQAIIERIGLEQFYQRWETLLFSALDANLDGLPEWFVRSADCSAAECLGYLLRPSEARDADGDYALELVMISPSMTLVALNCSLPAGQWRPLFAWGEEEGSHYYRVYEKRDALYREISHCAEQPQGDNRATIRWYTRDGRRRTTQNDHATPGNRGSCIQDLQDIYQNCRIPAY